MRMKGQPDTAVEETRLEERTGSTMELRKIRKATAKKRVLDDSCNNGDSKPRKKSRPAAAVKRKMKLQQETEGEEVGGDIDDDPEEESEGDAELDQAEAASESNTMTLEQFTDIVLASEGLTTAEEAAAAAAAKKPIILEQTSGATGAVKEENNNRTCEMMTSLLQNNNDLIVEVKPLIRPKPVVLSPRQPPGSHLLPHHYKGKVSLSSSVVVSVKPRVQQQQQQQLATVALLPPQNKPPKIPHLVEEWFSKMQPPISEKQRPTAVASSSTEALNLSTKPSRCSSVPAGKTTQVYLRPIPNPPPKHQLPSITISPKVCWSGPLHLEKRQQQQPSQYSPNQSHSSSASSNSCASPKHHQVQPPRLSPPRLEITKVPASSSPSSSPLRKVGRATPFEGSPVHMETVKARAMRDVQMAHNKDMHGNFPIHMSVLMRKPELVRRYCCILQVLESSLDLLNEDRMTPLHLAIRDSSMEIIDILLAFGASPAIKDKGGNSSLHLATAAKSKEIMKRLMKNVEPKDLNALNDYGLTPLHIATLNGDATIVEFLIQQGADASIPDSLHGLTPLAMAKQSKLNHIIDHIPKKTHVEVPSR